MLRKRIHKDLLKQLDIQKVVCEFADTDSWSGENISCLFAEDRHDLGKDTQPSMSIDQKQGKTICFTCGYKASSIVGLAEDIWEIKYKDAMIRLWHNFIEPIVDSDELKDACDRLLSNENILNKLKEKRGITEETAKKLKFGWRNKRLWIPIFNKHGLCIDVRKYDLLGIRNKGTPKIFSYKKGYGGARLFPHNYASNPNAYFLLEGELDTALALQCGLNAFTVTSGASTFPKILAKLFKGCKVIVVPDNDKAGLKGAAKRVKALTRAGAKVLLIDPPWKKGKDFTDWILDGGDAAKLKSFVGKTKKPVTMPIEQVDLELSDKEQESIERAETTLKCLNSKGAFFKNDDSEIFYSASSGIVMNIAGQDFASYLSKISPLINQSTTIGRFIATHIRNSAIQTASLTQMGAWSLYREPATIFIYTNTNKLLKVNREGISEQFNAMGDDHVLIEAPIKNSTIVWNPEISIRHGLQDFFGLIGNNIACTDEDKYLVLCWLIGVLYREYIRSKPLVRFVAKSASGKSTATKLLSHLVYSEELLSPSASTVASSYYMARTHPLLLFDNIETRNMIPEFEDFLLTAATGGAKTKRKLASDIGVVIERTNCLVCSNGIEPLSRSELINRTIEIKLDLNEFGRDEFHEFKAIRRVVKARNNIFSALLKLSRRYVFPRILNAEVSRISSEFPRHSMERFNDYFALMALFLDGIWKYRPLEGYDSPNKLINHWLLSQDKSTADRMESTNDVLHFLESYIDRRDNLTDATIILEETRKKIIIRCTARELLDDFRVLARQLGIKCPWQNERQLGVRIADAEKILAGINWTIKKYRSGGKLITKLTKRLKK